ncbi:hypothetical protein H6503_02035 [Candidatus Woesearchaeota archaeon]|nr:hypothetical protein [Candidatus Woesearchaeota archaeon]
MKGFKTIAIVALMLCAFLASALAVDLGSVLDVTTKIDGDIVSPNEDVRKDFERGEIVDLKVNVISEIELEDVEITAIISGYEFNNIEPMSDTSSIFDMEPNVSYSKRLNVRIPVEVEEDNYKLRILVSNRYGQSVIYDYNLKLDSPRHGFQIEDVVFSPGTVVEAGRALLTTVRVENKGERDEDSVKVSVAIPELGVSASDFIDEIEFEDSETSEEMYMRIPVCAQPGDYQAVIEVRYNELREAVYENAIITVVESDACGAAMGQNEAQTTIALGATSQNLVPGEAGALYPLTITNNGNGAVAYSVSVEGTNDFASVQINPVSTFVLNGGDSQAVFVYLTPAEDAAEGQHVFTVSVNSGNEVLKQIPLTAVVEEGDGKSSSSGSVNLRDALEVGLIVLVVLLIILAVVVGIKKLKEEQEDNDDEDDVEGKTYY